MFVQVLIPLSTYRTNYIADREEILTAHVGQCYTLYKNKCETKHNVVRYVAEWIRRNNICSNLLRIFEWRVSDKSDEFVSAQV